ncbi:hypothetical protein H5410_004938 [Solanum commersonii]|uniref:Uncharacterized protein n=1 Tax=Solanum commersonii TaxID=4109 RepID=A0A9J6A5S4_SOLCO|nr:hypothetical protein H5410_004938 [Solanum commersonii]
MCANFVNYGTPDPIPGAPCCDTFLMQIVPTHEEGRRLQIAVMLQTVTSASKTGALRHDIHYWLGEDTSQNWKINEVTVFTEAIQFLQRSQLPTDTLFLRKFSSI